MKSLNTLRRLTPLLFPLFTLPMPNQGEGDAAVQSRRAEAIARTKQEILDRVEEYGGWDEIQFTLEPFREEIRVRLQEQRFIGGRLFRVGGNDFQKPIVDLAVQAEWLREPDDSQNSMPAADAIIDFDRKLRDLGIDLIVVPVPSKIEAYPHLFETEVPRGMPIAMGRLENMLYLLDNGVEVIDPLPTMLALWTEDDEIPVYEVSGHHQSGISARDLGAVVAERLERYTLAGRDLDRFSCEKRKAGERVNPGAPMWAWEVLDRGQPYDHVEGSEVVVIGDSNAFAFNRASWACHIARCTGIPITDDSISSGGSTAHLRLAGQGRDMLGKRKAVVWIFASVALNGNWPTAEITEKPSFSSLIQQFGVEEAIALYHSPGADPDDFPVFESDLNNLGYEHLNQGELDIAVELFRINTLAFPLSANAFDSLGEACLRAGDRDLAVESLEIALSLNPSETTRANSFKLLAQLGVDASDSETLRIAPDVLERLVGKYSLSEGNKGIVTLEDGTLIFEFVGQAKSPLKPLSRFGFSADGGMRVDFRADRTGEPYRRVIVSGQGMRFDGERID